MRKLASAIVGAILLTACSDSTESLLSSEAVAFSYSPGAAHVTNNNAAGPGSFAEAVQRANNDASIHRIQFAPNVGTVVVAQPVVFTGGQALAIQGSGATLDGSDLAAGQGLFAANGGGDLWLRNLSVRRAPGIGITVALPGSATGTVKVTLHDVNVSDNGSHGVLINDQKEYFTDPNSTSQEGSAASLDVRVFHSRFEGNGFTDLDQDGLRINEGGDGDLRAEIVLTHVEGNGGDGIELDERAAGDVAVGVQGTALEGNGSFSPADFDDGMDIDENGTGSIIGSFVASSATGNYEQGFDLNENNEGDLRVDMMQVKAIGNAEEGIEYEEDDDAAGGGDIVATLVNIVARENGAEDGDAGLKLREKGAGNLSAVLTNVEASRNFVSGIQLREDSDGDHSGRIRNAVTQGNDGDGIEFDENGAGNLAGGVVHALSTGNTGAGIHADQASSGTGALLLVNVTLTGNTAGEIIANAGVTVTQQ
jgi:hypothetical protein